MKATSLVIFGLLLAISTSVLGHFDPCADAQQRVRSYESLLTLGPSRGQPTRFDYPNIRKELENAKKTVSEVCQFQGTNVSPQARDANAWRSRSIYQLLTDRFAKTDGSNQPCYNLSDYCGGTFDGIKNNLDYIQGMGFDAIWISPIVENTPHGYHGYWAQDFDKVNHHFGSEQSFINLVNECHRRNIWVMIDVVANHVGPVMHSFEKIAWFDRAEHYHDYCEIRQEDFANDQWRVENCRLERLPDLKQENPWVKDKLLSNIRETISKFKIDGIRIDTVPEVPKWFWAEYTKAAGVFAVGEAFTDRYDYIAGYQDHMSLLNYGLYYTIRGAFQRGESMRKINGHYQGMEKHFRTPHVLGNFVDNHDNERFLFHNANHKRFESSIVMSMLSIGIPIVYYGSEQYYGGGKDPLNREQLWTNLNRNSRLYQMIRSINEVRKQNKIWGFNQIERYVDDDFYAFSRGAVFVALTNRDTRLHRRITSHPYNDGQRLCNIFHRLDCVVVRNGSFDVHLNDGEAKVFTPR